MDNTNDKTKSSAGSSSADSLTSAEIETLKTDTISKAKAYAQSGKKTRKDPLTDGPEQTAGYDWWENQGTFEKNIWSVAYWNYDNQKWQLQATKVELQADGHTKMISFSIRPEDEASFPDFQIYSETKDELYHQIKPEDLVYLNRVMNGLKP